MYGVDPVGQTRMPVRSYEHRRDFEKAVSLNSIMSVRGLRDQLYRVVMYVVKTMQ
jgi:hypothetical protein